MTKIVLITHLTPTRENYNGPSALPYYLIKHRTNGVFIKIYTYNANKTNANQITETARELGCEITCIHRSFLSKVRNYLRFRCQKLFRLPVQNLIKLNEKYVAEIHSLNPDKIWVYPSHLTGIISQFEMYDIVVTGPDCSALNFYRKMGDINYAGDRNIYNTYRKHLKFEQYYTNKSNIMLHLVGMDDLKFLKQLYPSINAFYMQHPHYSYLKKTSYFTSKKMTVLIAGQYNHYVKTDFDRLFRLLLNDNTLVSEMSLTFIGKGWTRFSNELHNQGYETSEIIWVEEYFSKLIEYDIQVFPISLGVGTKGKVLDALCCGLICIGSKYAFENIAVQHGVSCIQYDFVDNIPNILKTIKENKEYYIQLAKKGQSSVLKHHSPEMIANMFYRKIHEK